MTVLVLIICIEKKMLRFMSSQIINFLIGGIYLGVKNVQQIMGRGEIGWQACLYELILFYLFSSADEGEGKGMRGLREVRDGGGREVKVELDSQKP